MTNHSTIYDKEGNLWVCGSNSDGQIGLNREKNVIGFKCLLSDSSIISIESNINRTMIVKKNEDMYELWATGENIACNIDINSISYQRILIVPTLIMKSKNHLMIKTGGSHNIILETNAYGHKKVLGFGDNTYNQLGLGTFKNQLKLYPFTLSPNQMYDSQIIMEDSLHLNI